MSVNVIEVNEANFNAEVEQAGLPVFVDFWAPWCGPCKALAPLFEQLAQAYRGQIKFVKVNADDNPELSKRFAVRGLPTMLLLRKGEEIERIVGAQSKAHITNALEQHVELPVTLTSAAPPQRHLRAFYGDATLREAVVERVRSHIEAGQIVSFGGTGPVCELEQQRFSLMGAALHSADPERFEGTLGIPAHVGRLAEIAHTLLMQRVEVDGAEQYHFRKPASEMPLEWLRAIPLGADLQTLTPRFIRWLLEDISGPAYLFGAKADAWAVDAARQVAALHGRLAAGDVPQLEEWKAIRTDVGAKVVAAREQATAELYTRIVARCAEMLSWPTDQLDEALAGAIGTLFFGLQQEGVREGLSEAQWAERTAVTLALRDRQVAEPDATPEQMAAFAETKAYEAMVQQYQSHDQLQGLKAKHLFGLRLHLGLMQCLAATARPVEA